ncbi:MULTISPECIES: hypothetical protein [Aeromicrobium]|uniref:hypothetical protein n=1 Tax=Aeromicrobium TaxID=2040 RepID=UPI0006FB6F9B|nr:MULTISPECIES: hypothetical protein [Aeromicrobium]KQX76107.1 hypothetical protein ASD10_13545 [Aeromicrobium sp. Root472D3]MCL8250318.1 hypothetical protein [Aeromicrobium fastidiosum]
MRTSARVAATLLTTTVVIGGTATSAFAQAATVKDRSADVISYADLNDEQGTVLGKADSVASGADIRSLKVDHGKKKVTVTLKFADLKSTTAISVGFRPNSKSRPDRVLVNTGRKSGEVYSINGKVRCAAPLKTKLGKGGYVKATIKRSCLGTPKKLKVTAFAVRYTDGGVALVDSLSKGDPRGTTYTKSLKAS